MQFTRKKKIAAAAAVGAIVLASGGVAIAYWTSSGSGAGDHITTAQPTDTLTYDNSTPTDLAPGVDPEAFDVTVNNTGGSSAYVADVKAYITVVEEGTLPGTGGSYVCSSADYLINGSPAPGTSGTAVALTWTATDIAPGDSSTQSLNTVGFNDLAGQNQDNCQGATVTIHYISS